MAEHNSISILRLQPILVSRFIINLRKADNGANGISTKHETVPASSTLHFRTPSDTTGTVVGEMGQPLDYEPLAWQDDISEGEGVTGTMDILDKSETDHQPLP